MKQVLSKFSTYGYPAQVENIQELAEAYAEGRFNHGSIEQAINVLPDARLVHRPIIDDDGNAWFCNIRVSRGDDRCEILLPFTVDGRCPYLPAAYHPHSVPRSQIEGIITELAGALRRYTRQQGVQQAVEMAISHDEVAIVMLDQAPVSAD